MKQCSRVRYLLAIGFSLLAVGLWAQSTSRMPKQPVGFIEGTWTTQNWLSGAYAAGNGDRDQVNVIFFEVPDTVTSTLYFAVKDPGSTGNADEILVSADTTTFYLIGGANTYSAANSRLIDYSANRPQASAAPGEGTGSRLTSFTGLAADNENLAASPYGWVYFAGVSPSQGEHIGNKYYFKIAVEVAQTGSYKNGYQLDVSLSNSGVPTGVSGVFSFAYNLSLGIQNDTDAGYEWSLYPFLDDSLVGWIGYLNFDLEGVGTGEAYNVANAVSRTVPQAPVPAISPNGGTLSQLYPIAGSTNGTWLLDFYEGASGLAINTSEFWFTHSTDAAADAGDTPLKMYSSFYQPVAADHVSVSPASQTTITSGTGATLTLQVADAAGNPLPYVRIIGVTTSGSAIINGVNNDQAITTNGDGLATLTVTDAVSETVNVTLFTDGTHGSTAFGAGTDGSATVTFVANPDPLLSSASNTSFVEGTGTALPVLSIAANGGTLITLGNDIRIRIPSALNAVFSGDTDLTGQLGGTAAGKVSATASYPDSKTLLLDVTANFITTDTLTITGLLLTTPTVDSSGRLELAYNGATPIYSVIDDKVITILDTNATYTWVGTTTSWTTAANWSPALVPPATANAVIPFMASGFYPTLGANTTINNITIGSSATLNTGAFTLMVSGSSSVSGTIIGTVSLPANLSGTYSTGGGNLVFSVPVTLAGDTTLNTGSGMVTFQAAATVNGSYQLNIASSGAKSFQAPMGSLQRPTRLALSGTGAATFSAASYLFAGNTMQFDSPVVVAVDTTLEDSLGSIIFNSTLTLNATVDLILSAPEIDFNNGSDSVTGTGSSTLTLQAYVSIPVAMAAASNITGDLDLIASDIAAIASGFQMVTITTTNPAIGWNGTATLKSPTTVSGDFTLAGGTMTLGGNLVIAGTTAISGGTLVDGGYSITSRGNVSLGGTLTLTGSWIFDSSSNLTSNGLSLAAASILNTRITALQDAASFTNTLSGAGTLNANNQNIALAGDWSISNFTNTGSTVTFMGTAAQTVSGAMGFNNIVINKTNGSVAFQGALTANGMSVGVGKAFGVSFNQLAGAQVSIIGGATTLDATGAISFGNAATDGVQFTGGITAIAASGISLYGPVLTDNAGIDFSGRTVTLYAASSLDTEQGNNDAGGAVSLGGASIVSSGANYALAIDSSTTNAASAGGNVTLGTFVNAANDISNLSVDTTGGAGGTNGTLTAAAAVYLAGTLSLDLGTATDATITAAGTDIATLIATSALNVTLGDANTVDLGGCTVSGMLDISAVTGITDSVATTAPTARFAVTGSGSILVNTLTNDFDTLGASTNDGSITVNEADGLQLGAATGIVANNGMVAILSTGAITMGNTVSTSGTGTTIDIGTSSGGIIISSNIEAANNALISLSATTGSITRPAIGTVGFAGSTSIVYLNAPGAGASIGATGLSIETNCGTLRAQADSGGIYINDATAITVGDGVSGVSTANNGPIVITTTNGVIATGRAMVTAGSVDLDSGGGTQRIDLGHSITTSGDALRFYDAVRLIGNSTITTTGGAVSFDSTVDADATGNNRVLAIAGGAAGNVTFTDIVGTSAVSTTRPLTLTVSSSALLALGSVYTEGLQSYSASTSTTLNGGTLQAVTGTGAAEAISFPAGPVLLASNVSIQTPGGAADNILFGVAVDDDLAGGSNHDLNLNAGALGTITFSQALGANGALADVRDLTVGSAATTTFSAAASFGGNVSISSDEIDLNGVAASFAGAGTLVLQPVTATVSTELAGAGGTAALDLRTTDLLALADGFISITIGYLGGTGILNVAGAAAFKDPVTLRHGGGITLAALLSNTGSAITFSSAVTVTAASVTVDTTAGGMPAGADIVFSSTVNDDGAVSDRTLIMNYGTAGISGISTVFGGIRAFSVLELRSNNLALSANLNAVTIRLYTASAATIMGFGGAPGAYNVSDAEFDYLRYTGTAVNTGLMIGEPAVQSGAIALQSVSANAIASAGRITINSTVGTGSIALDDTAGIALSTGGSGIITLNSGTGGITANATNGTAELSTSGTISLNTVSAGATNIGTPTNTIELASSTGTVSMTASNGSGSAALRPLGNQDFGTITTGNRDLYIYNDGAGTDTRSFSGTVSAGTGTLTLDSSGAVTQTFPLSAASLRLLGTGPYTLDNIGNDMDNLAGSVSLGITFVDTDGLTVTTVITSGLSSTGGGNIILAAGTNVATHDLTISQDIVASGGAGTIALYAGDGIAQNANVNSGGNAATLYAGRNYQAGLDVATGAITTGAGVITGSTVTLNAGTGVGVNAGARINTAAATINSNNHGTGNIAINETDGVTFASVIANNGAIELLAGGATIATSVISTTSAAANDITITTTVGDIDVGTIDAKTAGDINLVANTVAGQSISDGNAGALNVTADVLTITCQGPIAALGDPLDTNAVSCDLSSTNAGGIFIAETDGLTLTAVDTANGPITVTAAGLVTATNVTSTLDNDANDITISTTAGNMAVSTINAGVAAGDINLVANTVAGQSISDGNAGALNVTADVLTITCQGPIAALGDPLETSAVSCDLSSTNAGGIFIAETDGITLTSVDTANGPITVTAAGLVTATNVTSTLDNDANDITISTTAGNMAVSTINAGVAAGDISLMANTLAGQSISDGNGAVLNLTADVLTITCQEPIAAMGDPLETSAVSCDLSSTNAGGIFIAETDGITLTSVDTANGPITVTAAGLVTATNVTSTLDNDANDITISTTAGNMAVSTINAGVAAGDISLTANTIAGQSISDGNGAVLNLTADVLTITCQGPIAAAGDPLETMVVSCDLSSTNSGGVFIAEASGIALTAVDTVNGPISVTAAGLVTATSVVSTTDLDANDVLISTTVGNIDVGTIDAKTAGDITLTANSLAGQSVSDGNGAVLNLTADVLTITCQGPIAAAGDPLETMVVSCDLSSTNTGGVFIAEASGITLTVVDTVNGPITVTSAGLVTATSVVSTTDLDANDILISTTVGNIDVGTIDAKTAGDITLTANSLAGQSVSDGNGAVLNLTADVLTITCQGPIAAAGDPLETTVVSCDLSSTNTGGVFIAEASGITLTAVDTVNGPITVSAAGLVTATSVTSTLDNDANDITISTTAGIIVVSVINAGAAAGDIILTANTVAGQSVTDGNAGALNLTADTLTITAVSSIGTILDSLETSVVSCNLTSSSVIGTNEIAITEADGLSITTLLHGNSAGNVQITTINGTISVDSAIVKAGTGSLALTAGGAANDIDLNAAVDGGAGNITLNAVDLIYLGTAAVDDMVTSGGTINFQTPVSLTADTHCTTGPAGGNIAFDSSISETFALSLTAGTGDILFTGPVGATRLGAITVNSATNVTAAGVSSASFLQSAGTGTTTFNGALDFDTPAGLVVTAANISVNNTVTTTVGGVVTLNPGTLLAISAAGDMNITGAFNQGGAGTVTTAGDISTSDASITFAGNVSVSGDMLLDTNATVVNTADLSLPAVATAAAVMLTINTGPVPGADLSMVSFADMGTATLALDNIGGTTTFSGALSPSILTVSATVNNVTMLGGCTVDNAVSFLNTGNLTLGDALADTFTFTGGMSSVAAGTNIFQGTVATGGGAGQNISLDDLSLGGVLTLNCGASGNFIFTGSVAVSNQSLNADVLNANGTVDNDLTVIAALINTGAGNINIAANATLDIGSSNFTVANLSNLGSLRLTGLQVTHTFTAFDTNTGVTEYYGTSPAGQVFTTGFSAGIYWDLRVAGSGAGVHSLQGPITVNNDMRIQTGVLDVTPVNNYLITVAGNWRNDAGHPGFLSRAGTATFDRSVPGTIEIRGNNTWFVFECLSAFPGLEINFENDLVAPGIQITQRVAVGGIFRVRGSNPANFIRLDRITDPIPADPGNPPVDPGDDIRFWFFDLTPGATLDLEYAHVYYSNARSSPVSVPANVLATPYATYYCYKWLDFLYTIYSYTEDSDYNGKIDRIRVTAEAPVGTLVPGPTVDFSDFLIVVDGYAVDTSKGVNGYERPVSGVTFYIHLVEKPYLDTGATPEWYIAHNGSLYDESTQTKRVGTLSRAGGNERMIPGDTAWPVIGYTLSIPTLNETFVQFSEPVVQSGGGSIGAGDFGAGSFSSISGPAPGTREALVGLGPYSLAVLQAGLTPLTVAATTRDAGSAPYWEIAYNGQIIGPPSPTYPAPASGYLADPNTYGSFGSPGPNPGPITRPVFQLDRGSNNVHRVSDLLISVQPSTVAGSWSFLNPASSFIWPIWAKDAAYFPGTIVDYENLTPEQSASLTLGFVRAFNGTQWLRDQDWTLQARDSTGSNPASIWVLYDSNVASSYLSATPGIWLPPYAESNFSGIAAYPNLGVAPANLGAETGLATNLWNWNFLASDPKVFSVSTFDFWFRLSGAPADLYAGRLDMPAGFTTMPVDWYRRVKPFSLEIHDISTQKSGVTILNNVINPLNGERVRLNYTLQQQGMVSVNVFTLDGDVVTALYRGSQAPGDYTVNWDGRNNAGRAVARGIYFVRIVAPGIDEIRKIMVVK